MSGGRSADPAALQRRRHGLAWRRLFVVYPRAGLRMLPPGARNPFFLLLHFGASPRRTGGPATRRVLRGHKRPGGGRPQVLRQRAAPEARSLIASWHTTVRF